MECNNYSDPRDPNQLRRDSTLNISSADEQKRKALQDLYKEFQKCFETRNSDRIKKIKELIITVQPDSPILSLINGQEALYTGKGEIAYDHLQKYIKTVIKPDVYGLSVIAMWNKFAKKYDLAIKQFTACMKDVSDLKTLANLALHSIDIKKAKGFFKTALECYQRLLYSPDGYRMILYIKLQEIHIYISRAEYEKADIEINKYMQVNHFNYIRRLKGFLLYKVKSFKDLCKLNSTFGTDAYLLYLIGRLSIEKDDLKDVLNLYEEALKMSGGNPYIYNSYGNCLYSMGKINDAAFCYAKALKLDPYLKTALDNLSHFTQLVDKEGKVTYFITESQKGTMCRLDEDPDPEVLGFFNIYELFGYTSFKLSNSFLRKNCDLKPY